MEILLQSGFVHSSINDITRMILNHKEREKISDETFRLMDYNTLHDLMCSTEGNEVRQSRGRFRMAFGEAIKSLGKKKRGEEEG